MKKKSISAMWHGTEHMKLLTEIRPRDDGAEVFLATSGKEPSWAILRWNEERADLRGVCGTPGHDGLSVVRPVKIHDPRITAATVGTIATHAFLSGARLQAKTSKGLTRQSLSQQVDAWESFLGTSTPTRAREEADTLVELDKDQVDFLIGTLMAQDRDGLITMGRVRGLKVAEPISGFDAIRFQAAMAKVIPDVPRPPKIDIEAARAALSGTTRPSSRAVIYYGTGKDVIASDRQQASRSYPVLAGMIADNPLMAMAVDNREALQPLLIERTGLGKGALKRLAKVTAPLPDGTLFEDDEDVVGEDALGVNRQRRIRVTGAVSIDAALKYLSQMPPDRVPQDDRSWSLYHDILAGCAIPLQNSLGIPVEKTLAAVKGDWQSFHATLAKAADFDVDKFDRRAIALCTIDAIEAIEDFGRTIVLPLMLNSIADEEQDLPHVEAEFFQAGLEISTRLILGESKNIASSLLEMARRYASRIPALMDIMGVVLDEDLKPGKARFMDYDAESFPLLCAPFIASNALVVRPLANFAEMREESRRLSHCLGHYYLSAARTATSHVFSVQSPDGKISHTTIELAGVAAGENMAMALEGLRIKQHRGLRNCAPTEQAAIAGAEWMAAIKSRALPINLKLINDWRAHVSTVDPEVQQARTPQVNWRSALGVDWADRETCSAAWEEWRNIVGGSCARSEHSGIVWKDRGARRLVGAMSPVTSGILEQRAREARENAQAVPAP